ncbi:tRNA adenosine(34) deaminase TadA [Oceanobacter sp. 1_MG-2023]|uniref:tRNA adenosine(34) deaminase TadA n=1 Tax=unclassified Oceanobacter TaxID=2620260 RepID=UPI00351F1DE4
MSSQSLIRSDEEAMTLALALAQTAADDGEVPVGAVVVLNGQVIGRGRNRQITDLDPSAHAEMLAIREAAATIGNYRLSGACLYVTLEPCTMCYGLLVHSRIERLVYGASEPKSGAVHSAIPLAANPVFNHTFQIESGVMAAECGQMLSAFFAARRAARKRLKALARQPDTSDTPIQEEPDASDHHAGKPSGCDAGGETAC